MPKNNQNLIKPKLKLALSKGLRLPKGEYKVIKGTLKTYFETGMECTALGILDSSIKGTVPNPCFMQLEPESKKNFKYYSPHEAFISIKDSDIIKIDGIRFVMINDFDMMKKDNYRLSYYPQGFTLLEIRELFMQENVKVTLYRRI